MRFVYVFVIAIAQHFIAAGQYKVVIRINTLPASPAAESIYIAGNFNNWNPKDELTRLTKGSDGKFAIVFPNEPPVTMSINLPEADGNLLRLRPMAGKLLTGV